MAVDIIQDFSDDDINVIECLGQMGALQVWQSELSEFLGVYKQFKTRPMVTLHEVIQCISVEANEALAPWLTGTKPWKPPFPDLDDVDEEMIDILHYLLTWFNLRNWDAQEVLRRYRSKNAYNFERRALKLAELKKAQENNNA